ncbi:hypothetical protein PQX77_021202 [Marasmius sp. AFHP31]|nr:hypothetical protein PQX77_021202 [Marasmius sp. AFHP31]
MSSVTFNSLSPDASSKFSFTLDTTPTFLNSGSTTPSTSTAVGSPNSASPISDSIKIDPRIFSVARLRNALARHNHSEDLVRDRYDHSVRTLFSSSHKDSSDTTKDLQVIKVGGSDSTPTQLFCESLVDPSARGIMQSLLSTSFLPDRLPKNAIRPVYDEEGRTVEYRLDETFAAILRLKFQVIGTFVVAVGNGLDRLGAEDCPLAVPKDIFSVGEWNQVYGYADPVSRKADSFPFIRLANPRSNNPFIQLTFVSIAHAQDFLKDSEYAFNVLVRWATEVVHRSISLGNSSLINIGGPFFITRQDYLRRVGRLRDIPAHAMLQDHRGWDLIQHPVHYSRSANSESELSLILHPIYSSAVRDGAIDSIDYDNFNIRNYIPSAYVTDAPESENSGSAARTNLKRKREESDEGFRVEIKKANRTGGAM